MNDRSGVTPVRRRSQPRPSKLYPVLWRFAAERQRIYLRRLAGEIGPWTDDPVLSAYRFTNAFRAADRVSQHLIRLAYADPSASDQTLFLRTLLFMIFNRIDTWEYIVQNLGPPVAFHFDYAACDELLGARLDAGAPIYSAAYIMPSGGRRGVPKHRVHLGLLRGMVTYGFPQRVVQARSLEDAYTAAAAYRRAEPVVRGLEVHAGHPSSGRRTIRQHSNQAAIQGGRRSAQAVLSAEVGIESAHRRVVRRRLSAMSPKAHEAAVCECAIQYGHT